MQLVECVPNFSEGRDRVILDDLDFDVSLGVALDRGYAVRRGLAVLGGLLLDHVPRRADRGEPFGDRHGERQEGNAVLTRESRSRR